MGATPWTELTTPETGWSKGFPKFIVNDFYEDFLFEGAIESVTADSYSELSLSVATPNTELTAPSTSWTELTG